jgi:hypothetical protein
MQVRTFARRQGASHSGRAQWLKALQKSPHDQPGKSADSMAEGYICEIIRDHVTGKVKDRGVKMLSIPWPCNRRWGLAPFDAPKLLDSQELHVRQVQAH